ncbi:fasciclin domain-containing protein [Aliifodinibius sp. 1BSP15-2V2]|uniref:Fasciclin domain-containing protein n=1 Tax=Fodinibius salsisoli TaxID=2820877 RepID=A0ABT3PN11_9BACT|nr:fasciclin domain-containing protein [Fodinibius salsisoli]
MKLCLALVLGVTLFTACDDDNGSGPDNDMNISETLELEDNLSSAYGLIDDQGLADTLSSDGPITVFIPTDTALDEEDLGDMSDEEIQTLLKYHIVWENLTFDNLKDTESVESFNGDSLYFSADSDTVTINEDQTIITDEGIEATNGIIFKVDTVLTAPE